jgi:hypothetical protein
MPINMPLYYGNRHFNNKLNKLKLVVGMNGITITGSGRPETYDRNPQII